MAETRHRGVRFEAADGRHATAGELAYTVYATRERWLRAASLLLLLWAIALATLFIPIAHFVLVPTFLILGPVAAYRRLRAVEAVEQASGVCPTCGQHVTIAMEPNDRLPKWTYCPASNDSIRVLEDHGGSGVTG